MGPKMALIDTPPLSPFGRISDFSVYFFPQLQHPLFSSWILLKFLTSVADLRGTIKRISSEPLAALRCETHRIFWNKAMRGSLRSPSIMTDITHKNEGEVL